jgi:cystathionine beta-lyase/cystathionine gamma-synthase
MVQQDTMRLWFRLDSQELMMNNSDQSSQQLSTRLVHGDRQSHCTNSAGLPTVLPIYTSTTYLHQNAEALEQACNDHFPSGEQVYTYAQQGNPNAYVLEQLLAQVEGGVGAVTFGSGMAAIHAAFLAAGLAPGSKILAAQDLYGATIGLLQNIFIPLDVKLILRDLSSPHAANFIRAEQPDVIFVETLSNPLVKVMDLDAVGAAAHEVGAVIIVDSTFTTPYLVRPLEHGLDLVVHSATKFLGGHGDSSAHLFPQEQFGGILSLELKQQSREAVFCFMDKLKLCLPATSLGDVYSLVSYPPMSSHRDLTEAERRNMGITEGCVRLSVGIEDVGDIIHDLEQALSKPCLTQATSSFSSTVINERDRQVGPHETLFHH